MNFKEYSDYHTDILVRLKAANETDDPDGVPWLDLVHDAIEEIERLRAPDQPAVMPALLKRWDGSPAVAPDGSFFVGSTPDPQGDDCVGCERRPLPGNDPCYLCGRTSDKS